MSRKSVPLQHGWKIGDETHNAVELRAPTVGDIIDAGVAAERLVETANGYQLVQSPTRAGIEVLMRQIVNVGTLTDIPVSEDMLRALDPDDFDLLQEAANALGKASLETTEARGRSSAGPAES